MKIDVWKKELKPELTKFLFYSNDVRFSVLNF